MKIKAMVTKIDSAAGVMVVLTKDKQFKRVPLPDNHPYLGQTIDIDIVSPVPAWYKLVKSRWIAAAVVVFVLASGLFGYSRVSTASTYITLDMKPSLQLVVDSGGMVKDVRPLNRAGEELVGKLDLDKKDVYAAVEDIMHRAAESGYFYSERDNLVVAGVSGGSHNKQFNLDFDKLRSVIYKEMSSNHFPGYVVINDTKGMAHEPDVKSEVSINKLIVVEKAKQHGVNLDPESLTDMDMTEILNKCDSTVQELFPGKAYRVTWQEKQGATDGQGDTPPVGGHMRNTGGTDRETEAKMPESGGGMGANHAPQMPESGGDMGTSHPSQRSMPNKDYGSHRGGQGMTR